MMFAAICFVSGISDADTLRAGCGELGSHEQGTVRLSRIAAAEKNQALCHWSKGSLSGLCF